MSGRATGGEGPGDRLIVALDFDRWSGASALVDRLGGLATRLKVGLELYTAEGPPVLRELTRRGARVMLDLKLHDIPETVSRAVARATELGVDLLTVHTAGGRRMLEAAAEAARRAGGTTRLVGVTVLTSLDDKDLAEVGVEQGVEETVRLRALLAMECGLDGVVASPREAAAIRAAAPEGFLIVTPGVRPAGASGRPVDDQKRVATPRDAIAAGADYLVVGRPVRDAVDPRAAFEAIAAEIS